MRGVVLPAALLGLLFNAPSANAVYWTSNGPFGGATVQALAINPTTPTTLYAGTGGGVFDTRRQVGSACVVNSGRRLWLPPGRSALASGRRPG